MDITVKIVVDENAVSAINYLADAISGATNAYAIKNFKKKAGTVNTDFEKAFEDNKTSEVKPEVPEEKTEASLSSDATAAEPIHTIDDLREIAVKVSKKKGNEAVKRILNSFGFGKISDTAKDKLDEVYKLFEEEL
jgi:Sec-independent protein translocase protein TatA